jgi:hypothetical protein
LWQFKDLKPTRLPAPNGTVVLVNVTRNYTYHVAPASLTDNALELPRALRRYEWTQGLPFAPDPSTDRFCAVFDYTQDYVAGPPDIARFGGGKKCAPA